MVKLSQQQIAELRKEGYNDAQISQAVNELEKEELQGSYRQGQDPRMTAQQSSFGSTMGSDDLVKWQLELNDILERAEHILRGDKPHFENGNVIWKKNDFPEDDILNEHGVELIMKIISNYINRNTILSDYTEEEVRYKVLDFGKELNNLIFMKYEEMGMDTEDKRKEYPMLVRQIVDLVHSSYARAKDGGERRSLREMIQISQSQNYQGGMSGEQIGSNGMPMKSRSLLNPMRYISGKYAT